MPQGPYVAVFVADANGRSCAISVFAVSASVKWQPVEKYPESKNLPGNYRYVLSSSLTNQNGFRARKESLQVPFSQFDYAIAKLLQGSGYLKEAEKRLIGKKSVIDIRLKYEEGGRPSLTDFKLMSKPSRHMYTSYAELKPVKQGFGLGVLSTSSGIMTSKEARKKKVGGEYLFEIW